MTSPAESCPPPRLRHQGNRSIRGDGHDLVGGSRADHDDLSDMFVAIAGRLGERTAMWMNQVRVHRAHNFRMRGGGHGRGNRRGNAIGIPRRDNVRLGIFRLVAVGIEERESEVASK